ncbi:MAG: putative O-glycosylation ligase, exosortase A system-associated [Deltaproteobacteria bacterium]|nr:putative O-glycosylation ligase, exosortase A system-associated [Deltaproteobacteria bacterium]
MRDYLLLAIVFGSIPFILMRPWIGVLMWTWIGLMNPHLATWGIAKAFPVAKTVGLTALVALFLDSNRKPVPWNKSLILMALMFIMFIITSTTAWMPQNAFYKLILVFKIFLMMFVSTMLIYGKYRVRIFFLIIALSIGFYGIKGGVFSLATGGQFRVWGPGNSFIGDNNSMGLALNMILPLFVFMPREESNRYLRMGLRCSAPLIAIAALFTYSRGALLGLCVVCVFMFPKLKQKALVVFLLIPLILYGITKIPDKYFNRAETIGTYEQDKSAMTRLQAWSVAWNIAIDRPLTGAGFDFNTGSEYRWLSYSAHKFLAMGYDTSRAAHSIYFQILGDHGFIGLFLFLSLLFFTMYDLRRIRKQAVVIESKKWIANYALPLEIGLWGYIVSGAFLSLAYFDLFYCYVGAAAILQRELYTNSENIGEN